MLMLMPAAAVRQGRSFLLLDGWNCVSLGISHNFSTMWGGEKQRSSVSTRV